MSQEPLTGLVVYSPPSDQVVAASLITYSEVLRFAPAFSRMSEDRSRTVCRVWVNQFTKAGVLEIDVVAAFEEWAGSESTFPTPADIIRIARRRRLDREAQEHEDRLQEVLRREREVEEAERAVRLAKLTQGGTIDVREAIRERLGITADARKMR